MEQNNIVTNGCTGNCCAAFHLPFTPEEFEAIRIAWENYKFNCVLYIHALAFGETFACYKNIRWIDRLGQERSIPAPKDIEFILDMLIFLRLDPISVQNGIDVTEEFKQQNPDIEPYDGVGNGHLLKDGKLHGIYYTCKHFDKVNRICTQYDKRPWLCRHHGEGNRCEYIGCQLKCNKDVLRDYQGSDQTKAVE